MTLTTKKKNNHYRTAVDDADEKADYADKAIFVMTSDDFSNIDE